MAAGREHAAVTVPCGICQRVWPAPGLNDDIFGCIGLKHFVPSHPDLLAARDDLLDSSCEKHLQGRTILNCMRSHEVLNARVALPLLDVAFISSCVKVGIGE